jgi:hypothetical protein
MNSRRFFLAFREILESVNRKLKSEKAMHGSPLARSDKSSPDYEKKRKAYGDAVSKSLTQIRVDRARVVAATRVVKSHRSLRKVVRSPRMFMDSSRTAGFPLCP